MDQKPLSLRKFAKLCDVSPKTVSSFVRKGIIQRIPIQSYGYALADVDKLRQTVRRRALTAPATCGTIQISEQNGTGSELSSA